MNGQVIADNLPYLLLGAWPDGPLGGAALTLALSVASGLVSAAIGLIAGVGLAMVQRRVWRTALAGGLAFFRAVPIIMLIFWVYFLLPVAFGLDVPALATVVVALSLVGGAYLGHAVYAGISALPAAQMAAALALGMTRWQAMRHVILPQALPMMMPSFINQWVALIKDTSLAYVIGVGELSFVATQVSNRVMVYPLEIFATVAALYYLMCVALDVLAAKLQRRQQART